MNKGKLLLIFVLSLLVLLLAIYRLGGIDFLGINQNRISIDTNIEKVSKDDLKVLFLTGAKDTIVLYQKGEQLLKRTEDWYGKDHILVLNACGSIVCSLPAFKLTSYEKLRAKIDIRQISDSLLISWSLKTLNLKANGEDKLPLNCVNKNSNTLSPH